MGKRLYCNGDSFVAGIELGDDILPGYPGLDTYIDDPEVVKKSEWYEKSQTIHLSLRKQYRDEIYKLEQERCFAGQVSRLLNIPVTNRAEGGASHDSIARTTITDLLTISKQYPEDTIYAFIGTTHFSRSEIPYVPYMKSKEYWYNVTINNRFRQPEATLPLRDYKNKFENEYHWLMNLYKNVILLKEFCKSKGINLFFIATLDNYTNLGKENNAWMNSELINMPDVKLWQEYADINYIADMKKIRDDLLGTPILCPGGHYAKPVHDEITKIITNIVGN